MRLWAWRNHIVKRGASSAARLHAPKFFIERLERRFVMDDSYHSLSGGAFLQDWTNAGLLTMNNDWSMVPSIVGFGGQELTDVVGSDPQTLLAPGIDATDMPPGVVEIHANQTNPDTFAQGGVSEFETLPNPVVAMQGSGTRDAPFLLFHVNTTGVSRVTISFNLQDIDGSTDNSTQPVAIHYRVGTTGNFTNVPAGFVADASRGPSQATLVTPVCATLPLDAGNRANLQIRVITANAPGNDEWIGVDDIRIENAATASRRFAFTSTNYMVNENAGIASIGICSCGSTATESVRFRTIAGGSATVGVDYAAVDTIVPFGLNEAFVNAIVSATNDNVAEGAETVLLEILDPSGGSSLGSITTATLTIIDNDATAPAIVLNEVSVNPPFGDGPWEYAEVRGNPGTSLFNAFFVSIEGDVTQPGVITAISDLSTSLIGSSELLVVKSTSGGHVVPASTTVMPNVQLDSPVGGLQNGSNSFALIFSPIPLILNQDLDADNDGDLDLPAGAAMIDGVGWLDGTDPLDRAYAAVLSTGFNFTIPDAATRFRDNTSRNATSAWYYGDFDQENGASGSEVRYVVGTLATTNPNGVPAGQPVITPGAANYPVPPGGFSNSDLIVSAVSFSPASTQVGQPLNATFTIQNVGTAAAGPSKARVRLSVDGTLTLYDYPMAPLDVAVPFIPAGGSWTFTGPLTIPPGTPAGQYYLGVFADAFNVAGQTNVTNDAGVSAGLVTVTAGSGVPLPEITRESPDLPLNEGQLGIFYVDATVPGVPLQQQNLRYQWFKKVNGADEPVTGGDERTLRFEWAHTSQAGVYFVRVSNTVGWIDSRMMTLSVNGATPTGRHPDEGELLSYQDRPIDRNKPTLVITHGWQPDTEFPWGEPPTPQDPTPFHLGLRPWQEAMAFGVDQRLGANSVNLLMFVWSGAFTERDPVFGVQFLSKARYYSASLRTRRAGLELSVELRAALGPSYTQDIHWVGHSLGTMVNAHAINRLSSAGWSNGAGRMQATLLDAPLRARAFGTWTSVLYDDRDYINLMPRAGTPYGVDYVDNYYGTAGLPPSEEPAFGEPLEGAAPSGGMRLSGFEHSQVWAWYSNSIFNLPGYDGGFDHSVLAGPSAFAARPAPQLWNPTTLGLFVHDTVPNGLSQAGASGWGIVAGTATVGSAIVNGITQSVIRMITPGQLLPGVQNDAEISLNIRIDDPVTVLSLAYRVDGAAATDRFEVLFNGVPLFESPAENLAAGVYENLRIALGPIAGQTGVLSIRVGGPNSAATLELANMRLLDEQAPESVGSFAFEASQAVQLQFTESVAASLSVRDVIVTNVTTGQVVPNSAISLSYDAASDLATFRLNNPAALVDGNYTFALPAGSVQDQAGNENAASYLLDFFILAADANRDRAVDISDFAILAGRFNQPGTFSQGDFNYDGVTDIGDFSILASKFNTNLPPPVPNFQRGEWPSSGRRAARAYAPDGDKLFSVAERLIADWIDDRPGEELF